MLPFSTKGMLLTFEENQLDLLKSAVSTCKMRFKELW